MLSKTRRLEKAAEASAATAAAATAAPAPQAEEEEDVTEERRGERRSKPPLNIGFFFIITVFSRRWLNEVEFADEADASISEESLNDLTTGIASFPNDVYALNEEESSVSIFLSSSSVITTVCLCESAIACLTIADRDG